jgi:tryptophan 2,3-dioxygenase
VIAAGPVMKRTPPSPASKARAAAPSVYGEGDLDYHDYLQISTLLSIQKPQSDPEHHDEMLFIIIHQSFELWFKLILHEMSVAIDYMRQRNILRARHFVERIVQIVKLLIRQIHVLETMTPVEFLGFRDKLKPASGFQSIQFRRIEFMAGLKDAAYLRFFESRPKLKKELQAALAAPDLASSYFDLLAALGHDLPKGSAHTEWVEEGPSREKALDALARIYEDPEADMALYLLTETLMDLDENLSLWRHHHVNVVERIIGNKRGTGGSSGAAYLRKTTSKRAFPLLWDVRTRLEA